MPAATRRLLYVALAVAGVVWAVRRAAKPTAVAGLEGIGDLAYIHRSGSVRYITGRHGLPLQIDRRGRIWERQGATLARHRENVRTMQRLVGLSGLGKFKKALRKIKKVARKVAVHKIVERKVITPLIGTKRVKQFQNIKKKATPYVIIAGAAAATILTGGLATPALVGAVAAGGGQAAKDIAAKRQRQLIRNEQRRYNTEQAAVDAEQAAYDTAVADPVADGGDVAQGDGDESSPVDLDQDGAEAEAGDADDDGMADTFAIDSEDDEQMDTLDQPDESDDVTT